MFSITAPLTTALGSAAIGLAIATAGTASAGTADDAFVTQMRTVGIEFKSPQAANHTGRQVCKELAAGKTGVDVAKEIVSQTDMSPPGGLSRRVCDQGLLPAVRRPTRPVVDVTPHPRHAGIPAIGIPAPVF
jgi:hypothetical protein